MEQRDKPVGVTITSFVRRWLSPALSGDEGPAHVTLDLDRPEFKIDGRQGRWLLAESSWAEMSVVPRFVNLVHWIWKVSTCLLVLQFVIPMRRHWRLAKVTLPLPT